MDALALAADEGRGKTAISLGELSSKPSRGFPNGATRLDKLQALAKSERAPGELKHLSTLRKRNQRDSLSSGERKGNSLNPDSLVGLGPMLCGGCKAQETGPKTCHRVRKLLPS